ncbi:Gph Predicted phosphatases [Rhabdaerophilaceae bacterium]
MDRTLLLFDLDGTLVDSEEMILEAQRQTFAALGLDWPGRDRGLSIVGLSLPEAFAELAGQDAPIDALCEAYKQSFFNLRSTGGDLERLFAGASEIVAEFAAHPACCLGIATGKSQRGAQAIIASYGWAGLFETVQTADDAPSKPHPGMIENACKATGIPPARTIMIGDSSYDMMMAKSAKAQAVGVAWGFQSVETLRLAGAGVIVPDFEHLRQHIRLLV